MKFKDKKSFWFLLVIVNIFIMGILLWVIYGNAGYSLNQTKKTHLIGASYMTMNNEFYKIVSEEISARAEAEGDRLVLRDPALDAGRQIERLESINMGYNADSKDFDLGNVVFQPMSFSTYRAYKPYPLKVKKYTNFEWECIPMPAGPDGDNISTLDTLLIGMNKKSRNKDAAWDLIKTLTYNTKIQSEIFDYSEGVSVLKEVTESEQTLGQLVNGNSFSLAVLSNAVEEAVVVPRFRYYDEAISEVAQAVKAIIDGDYNISTGQIIWNRKINKYLKNSKWK